MNSKTTPPRVAGTARIEAFSDGVIAIIVTLLIFEVRVPPLNDLSSSRRDGAGGAVGHRPQVHQFRHQLLYGRHLLGESPSLLSSHHRL
ncbi:MAG: TMEM175 family protein [Anaerolineales bacterium]